MSDRLWKRANPDLFHVVIDGREQDRVVQYNYNRGRLRVVEQPDGSFEATVTPLTPRKRPQDQP